MKKFALALATALILGTAGNAAYAACDGPIKYGWEDWPPFQIATPDGPTGMDVEMIQAIGAEMGCDIELIELPWQRALASIESGDLDVVAQASITDERAEYANFSDVYMGFDAILFVGADHDGSYDSLEDFLAQDNVIGISHGYSYGSDVDAMLAQDRHSDQVETADDDLANARMVAAGRIDGTVANRFTMAELAREHGLDGRLQPTDVVVQSEPVYWMFSKESVSPETIEAFNEAMAAIKDSGEFDEIVARYQ